MNRKILIVDDEKNLLNSLKRHLRKSFDVVTAPGPEEGLAAIRNQGTFAVILSDLRMPVMDGIEFLARAQKMSPDTVRMMLTGNADLQNAINAVNEGNIYRFLTKPCAVDILTGVLNQGIEHYRLITAEKELLRKTLKGSILVLSELLALLNPQAFGRSSRIQRHVVKISKHLGISNIWLIETAAMLSQIGCVILPETTIKKLYSGQELSDEEARQFAMHPGIASDLISNIPRMETIARIIDCQERRFDGSDDPGNPMKGRDIPLGARILKVVLDFDLLESRGYTIPKILQHLRRQSSWYDPKILTALEEVMGGDVQYVVRQKAVAELKDRMILFEDVKTVSGRLLISRGQEVTPMLIRRLKNFAVKGGVQEPVRVLVKQE